MRIDWSTENRLLKVFTCPGIFGSLSKKNVAEFTKLGIADGEACVTYA